MAARLVTDPLSENNPITVQVLGICSALAVTVKVETAFVMCLALTFVITCSNLIVSLLRRMIPGRIRMIVEMSVIASLVVVTDEVLRAYLFDISRQLSVFVGLIITNCIVMGRAEAFAIQNPPGSSLLDGLGNGLGYSLILMLVAIGREVIGSGTFWSIPIFPEGYPTNGLAILAPGAFIILGLLIWIQRTLIGKTEEA
ncbi:NADH:ubiquinone reductase (Na(+)-transporting) subunit D [Kiritimatiella glycovorans]|uniref:Na(+)-translocating NADH-quinone reductase subunit D n=1 Tax=Kiritimatiella glycovorans TaxID=1307763 RepID=A0A0G3EGD9_9BACT|nr:NADH:ubiquinone reductase (Na(+)-transporting) subunit D [Kiritimatiella glycovorans]AKJ63850.1 Na(+)-translocating NADH-quinone reductase subunit D [Kiritimatiella glycovorans]